MTAALAHRGPDSGGSFHVGDHYIGMRRLAVLDPTARADQPMVAEGGRVAIVYNGETYNFEELGRELNGADSAPRSDTAVLLQLYLKHGVSFADRLQGMFAFAIVDARGAEPKLILGRDRLGIKPLWIAERPEGIFVASELRALIKGGVAADVDDDALFDLLVRGSVGQPASLVSGVSALRPGSVVTILRRARTERRMPPIAPTLVAANYPDRVQQVRAAVERAVHAQLRSDVPVGAFISGGVDSAVIAAACAIVQPRLPLFTASFLGNHELDGARRTARHLGLPLAEIDLEAVEAADLERFAAEIDQPTVDGFNTWCLSRAVRRSVTVALSGTGGDEVFGGYPWFASMLERPSWRRRLSAPLARLASSPALDALIGDHRPGRTIERLRAGDGRSARFARLNTIFGVVGATRVMPGARIRDPVRLRPRHDDDDDAFRWTSRATIRDYLQSQLLRDIDVASMAHGLEVRVPLLDDRLVALGQALPMTDKIDPSRSAGGSYADNGAKRILIDAFAEELPPGLAHQRKAGFALPFDRWLRGPLREVAENALTSKWATLDGRLSANEIALVWRHFLDGLIGWPTPWLLAVLSLWYAGLRR